jgi:YHS domain-containing protein
METGKISELPMVCGRAIQGDPRYCPFAEYRGKVIYFCTEICRNAFISDPDRFYTVHSQMMKSGQEE